MSRTFLEKKKDLSAFTIPCSIKMFKFARAVCDLKASINLMPYSIFHKLGFGKPKPTKIKLLMSNRSIKKPIGVLHDMLVKVDRFIFPADFVILDCAMDVKVSIILGRPFLDTQKVLVDVESGKMKFWLNNDEVSFNVCKSMKQPMNLKVILVIDIIDREVANHVDVSLLDDSLVGVL
ncbi:uncharacterized protein LOC124899523 [Capsicum annuum]|uniref:uncharacterized protein LOC124899523 n=1 Tax=Capsicum annuum TaxID=4072 RepID=UPI001FB17DAE|nr:uncharacterized protein LOC124899523 [Capsicum annuum]